MLAKTANLAPESGDFEKISLSVTHGKHALQRHPLLGNTLAEGNKELGKYI